MSGLCGIEDLTTLRFINLANTLIVTESLLCLKNLSHLNGLNLANTLNVDGNMALHYISGTNNAALFSESDPRKGANADWK